MRKFFTLILALVASIGTMFAESGTCGDNLTWDLTNGVLTISGTGRMTDWVMYSSYAPWNSYRGNITSVIIGNGVTSIGSLAFYNCTGLTSVAIPNSVTSIGYRAFYKCTGLTSVTIPNSVTKIGDGAFWGCSGLTSIEIPNSVTSIGGFAFEACYGLTSVTIPNSVTSIGQYAFSNCTGLTSIEIPNSVTSIGNDAFYNCSGLTSITIPDSITYIGSETFYGCSGLTSVTIPNSVTSIGDGAFWNCTGLTSITCHAEVPPTCGNNAFKYVDKSIPLYVPANSVDAYKTANQWKDFTNIQAIAETVTSIDQITNDHSPMANKMIKDGQIILRLGDKTFTLTGQEVK